jgi:hypothetical protein
MLLMQKVYGATVMHVILPVAWIWGGGGHNGQVRVWDCREREGKV